MTLSRRDQFAMAAMSSWIRAIADSPEMDGYDSDEGSFVQHQTAVAKTAYGYADAMESIAKLDEQKAALDQPIKVVLHDQNDRDEIARLRAELAKYTGDLTDEQIEIIRLRYRKLNEPGDTAEAWAKSDEIIRKVRSGEAGRGE
jgi:hypothetical protein